MNTNLTEIAFILDRSGSMSSCAESAIAGFNEFIRDQKRQPGLARLTLVLFDDQYETPYVSIPISEAVELDTTTFVPRGSTALLDAIGRTIDELGAKLAAMPESERPACVIVPILTDGLENASQVFSYKDIQGKITRQRDVYNWQFLFLGANQDAIASAARIGVQRHDSATFFADAAGTGSAMKSITRKSSAIRKTMTCREPLTPEEQADLKASLQNITDEEDRITRTGKPDKGGKGGKSGQEK